MVVPAANPSGFTPTSFPPANSTRVPSSSSVARVCSSRRETAAIEGSASPRKPSVAIESRSSAVRSFDVAWRSNASSASSCIIPLPSSITRIMRLPPDSTSTRIDRAPASSAFSSSSFTTDAGRSTTSPAAMRFATVSGSIRILLIVCLLSSRTRSRFLRTSVRDLLFSVHPFLFLQILDRYPQFIKLVGAHFRRRIRHQILRRGRLRERDYLANRLLSREQHDDSVDPKRNPAVRRSAVGQRIEEEPKPLARLLVR